MARRQTVPQIAISELYWSKISNESKVEEEIEQVQEIIGSEVAVTGFYSYGEMAPFNGSCELHNQTMTLTLISE
jgi:hypothetical protein